MRYFRLKDWWDLQHYKDRAPIWIKLYTGDLSDPDSTWARLDDVQRAHLMGIRMLAAKYDNVIPYSGELVGSEIMATAPVDLGAYGDMIEVHPSKQACLRAEQAARGGAASMPPPPQPDSDSASKSASDVASKSASKPASKSASKVASGSASTRERFRDRKEGGSARARARGSASLPPSDDQKSMIEEIARERAVIGEHDQVEALEAFATAAGVHWPLRRRDVTALRTALERLPRTAPPDPDKLRRQKAAQAAREAQAEHQQTAAAAWEEVRPLLDRGQPDDLAAAVCAISPPEVRRLVIARVAEHVDRTNFAGAASIAVGALSEDLTADNLGAVLAAVHEGRRAWDQDIAPVASDPAAVRGALEAVDPEPAREIASCWLKLWLARRSGLGLVEVSSAIMEATHGFVLRPDGVERVYRHLGLAGPPAALDGEEVACGRG